METILIKWSKRNKYKIIKLTRFILKLSRLFLQDIFYFVVLIFFRIYLNLLSILNKKKQKI